MKETERSMISRLAFVAVAGSLLSTANAQLGPHNVQTVTCAAGGTGYINIGQMNEDMAAERGRILLGGTPASLYIFPLCENLVYDLGAEPLVPVLDGVVISCGLTGASANQCIFNGGSTQVQIESFEGTELPVNGVSLSGITFSDYTTTAIGSGSTGTDTTTVTVTDAVFTQVTTPGASLINQSNVSGEPFSVAVRDSAIRDVTLSSGFLNSNGQLSLNNIEVEDANLAGGLVSIIGSDATLQLDTVSVETSDIFAVVAVLGGADANIVDLTVQNMLGIGTVVSATGEGTEVSVQNANISNNAITGADGAWVGIEAKDRAIVQVTGSTLTSNTGSRALFSAISASTLTIQGTNVVGSTGADILTPTAVVEGNGATVIYRDSLIQNVDEYTAAIFMSFESNLDAAGICIDGTETEAVVFITQDSEFTVANNAVENMASLACGEQGERLAKETDGSECFGGSGDCQVDCIAFSEFATCAQIGEATSAPTMNQSDSPSSVPTISSAPSLSPSTLSPTTATAFPTGTNTSFPTAAPINATQAPSPMLINEEMPTQLPSGNPSQLPTIQLSESPTTETPFPTTSPSHVPSQVPSVPPSGSPSAPTGQPTFVPTTAPSVSPKPSASLEPSSVPTLSLAPSVGPSITVTSPPSPGPTAFPSPGPTAFPSLSPSTSVVPSATPTTVIACIPRPPFKGKGKGKGGKGGKGKKSKDKKSKKGGKTGGKKGKKRYLKKSKKSSTKYASEDGYYLDYSGGDSGYYYDYYPEEVDAGLPFCDEVHQPIVAYKGKGKGKGKGWRKLNEADMDEIYPQLSQ